MQTIRVRARVSGIVQGVWYRGSTCERAIALGLSGWVRNEADGAVVLEAEGPEAAVESLMQWCKRGPPAARVDAVNVERIEVTGAERGFDIRR